MLGRAQFGGVPGRSWWGGLVLVLLAVCGPAFAGRLREGPLDPFLAPRPVQGMWISPDWILPGDRTYTEAEVRRRVRPLMAGLKANGVNAVFLETLTRGTSIASGGETPLPVYPHLGWAWGRRGVRVLDTLQIFIDEADAQGIRVHAWTHLFYWRMDNDDVYRPWHHAPSLWDDLLRQYLTRQAAALDQGPLRHATLEVAASLQGGVDCTAMTRILTARGYPTQGHPLSVLVRALMGHGRPAPDFLLVSNGAEPFPPQPGRALYPLYLNPEHPVVQERLLAAITALSNAHPDLAGIHLDHVRFPMDAQGIPSDWKPIGRDPLYFDVDNPTLASRYQQYREMITRREQVLRDLVTRIRHGLFRTHALSAAVLPLYYVERGAGVTPDAPITTRVNGYDYSAQDWYRWDVDFVVPMMYGFDPWRIRTLVRRYAVEARVARSSGAPPAVVPGISKLLSYRPGLLDRDEWVFFDLTMGLDTRYVKERDEDYRWVPRKDL